MRRKLILYLIAINWLLIGLLAYAVPVVLSTQAQVKQQAATIQQLDKKVDYLTSPQVIQDRTFQMLLAGFKE